MQTSDKKVVMAFGTFDFFHAGHENYLKQAKTLGETLIVVIARDVTVKKVKGIDPTHNEKLRLKSVTNCQYVDKAVLGNPDDKYKVIKKYKPNILALGYDQFIFTFDLKKFFIKEKLDIEIIRLEPFQPQAFKSSILRNNAHQTSSQL